MLRMILNLLLIFISLNHLFIKIKAGNNGSSRQMRVGAASHSSRGSTYGNRQASFLQHLQINEAERPSQNSHIMPQGLASSSSALASDGSNNEECPICLHPLLASEELKKLSCNHPFHRNCIDTWLRNGNMTCPVCRREQVDRIQDDRVDRVDRVRRLNWLNEDVNMRTIESSFQHLRINEAERPSERVDWDDDDGRVRRVWLGEEGDEHILYL